MTPPLMVWNDIHELAKHIRQEWRRGITSVMTSGGFAPLHQNHLAHLCASKKLVRPNGLLVVVVNGDEFLIKKHGFAFQSINARTQLVAAIRWVDHVVAYYDGTQSVAGALRLLKPNIFAKGGDRNGPQAMLADELQACEDVGCRIEYGVGGTEKSESSSWIIKKACQQVRKELM